MVQVQVNQIFSFFEDVKFLVIMSSKEGTLEFSLHYIKVVITQREGCSAHNQVKISKFPTKETEFKQESHAMFHIFLTKDHLGKILRQRKIGLLVFRNTLYSVMSVDNQELSKKLVIYFYYLTLETHHWIYLHK